MDYRRPKKHNFFKQFVTVVHGLSLAWVCSICALILLTWGVFLWWQQSHFDQYFKFHHVKIAMQARHLDPEQLAQTVGKNMKGGFFSLNTDELSSVLQQQPWIKEITFRRLWPDTLAVKVVEREPVALWNSDSLISKQGQVFSPAKQTFPTNLVQLGGAKDDADTVMQRLQQFQLLLKPVGAKITALELNQRHSWQMEINGHFRVMLGQKNIESVFSRFVTLYPQVISPREEKTLSVDMRYPNGAAIRWRQAS